VWVQRFNYFGPLLNGVPTATVSATINFDPATPPAPVDLFMTPGMAISGRILDGRGQPATGMAATAYRATISDGKLMWSPVLSRPIDDRGEYRISPLPPGNYYIGVTPNPNAPTPQGQNPSVRTFFPGVTEPAEATKLTLKNNDSPGVDFTLRTAPSTLFKVSGVALNPNAIPGPDGRIDRAFNQFLLVPIDANLVDGASPSTFPNSTANRAAGEFELRNVRPGMYELFPLPGFSGILAGRTLVDVRNADAPGIRVVVNPSVPMQGRVVMDQSSVQRPAKFDSIRILARQLNAPPVRGTTTALVAVNEAGEFTIGGPAGSMAMLLVSGLPDTAFVSDIQSGNASVYDSGFEISSPAELLQVVIDTTNAGTVEATVKTEDGRAMPRATVVLVPPEGRRQNPMRYRVGTTDNNGRVILRGVAPGMYTAFAWESVPETAWQNNEFLLKYQTQGMAVTISPSAQLTLQLKGIPFDADLR
jgi:hypothetical protein